MKKFLSFLILFSAAFFTACASKASFSDSKAVFISLKSPQIKLSEAGFLYKNEDGTRLEVYKLGQPLVTLEVGQKMICLNSKCALKSTFNKQFFQNAHYEDFLSDILSKKPIYKGLNLKKNPCGYEQNILEKDYELFYKLCDGVVFFEDKKAGIKFSLKDSW